jgi:uracil-DNA glycosylase family 4
MEIYTPMTGTMTNPRELLEWYVQAGVDECTQETAQNRIGVPEPGPIAATAKPVARPASLPPSSPLMHSPPAAAASAREAADACATIEALEAAVRAFDGCALKRTATNTVFADGNPRAPIMLIGEAPGSTEDEKGIPFCGVSGQLLDRMLAAIGLTRQEVYITNTVYWRPPGNRQPSGEELAICEAFVQKHVALVAPKLLILAGGVAVTSVLKTAASISRLRGQMSEVTNPYLSAPVPATVIYHPSYLLRQPSQKRLAWHDLQRIKSFINEHNLLNNI